MTIASIDKLRAETPGCHLVLHFNNAGAALPPVAVVEAVKRYIDVESLMGGYEAAELAHHQTEKVYDTAAQLLHCDREEIAFTENATRAWDMAFYSFKFKRGDRILTARAEYGSNYLAFLQMAEHTGVSIDIIDNDASGQLDISDLQNKINDQVKLIAITHIPTNGGLVNPASAVGKIAKQANIPYLLDATQSVGQIPLDVQEIGCDFLCATGRKYLRGPRGTGFLYAKKNIIAKYDPPFVDIRSILSQTDHDYELRKDALRFETWECNIAAKIGLGVAIEYALKLGVPAIWERIQYLANQLRYQLAKIPSVELHDLGEQKCGIVTFTSKKNAAAEIKRLLSEKKINVSISLPEYAPLDMKERNLSALVRASIHYYNTEEEIDRFCFAVKNC